MEMRYPERLIYSRIFDKNHLLDATEIFRKLNVHKKVRRSYSEYLPDHSAFRLYECQRLTMGILEYIGVVHQAWFPPDHVLFLPIQVSLLEHLPSANHGD